MVMSKDENLVHTVQEGVNRVRHSNFILIIDTVIAKYIAAQVSFGEVVRSYTPPGWVYCSPSRLYGPTYRSSPHIPLEEVMWQVRRGGYSNNLFRRLCG